MSYHISLCDFNDCVRNGAFVLKLHFRLYKIFPEMNVWGHLVCRTAKKIAFKQANSHPNTIKFQVRSAYQHIILERAKLLGLS